MEFDSVKWTRFAEYRLVQLVARDAEFGATGGAIERINWLGNSCTTLAGPCVVSIDPDSWRLND